MLHGIVIAHLELDQLQEDLTFVLDPAELVESASGLRLRVVDLTTAAGIADAEVHLSTSDSTRSGSSRPDGSVAIVPWPPGPYLLVVRAAGHLEFQREIELPPGGVLDLDWIELQPIAPLRVRVPDGDRTTDVHVYCEPRAKLERFRWSGRTTIPPDADGEYEVTLAEGEQVVWAAGPGPRLSPRLIVQLEQAGSSIELPLRETVDLMVHPGRLAERRALELRDELGLPVDGPDEIGRIPVRFQVLAGRYRLLAVSPRGARTERAIEIGEELLEITLD